MIITMLITISMAQNRTSTNVCANEKTIFKLDIRQRVQNLPPNSTINDLNASALCEEAYMYDYIWLSQLWTPGEYNYKDVNGIPQQTKDYRELQSIKEYSMDSSLGTLTELYQLQTNIKLKCPHMKFLGEFSFYISADSYLLENATRFLRRPASLNKNIYSSRYDNENFAWAVNDQMKTIPNAVPWNYFDNIVIEDMKDLIYRVIIDQHQLDGIVFLQPSLGLYNVMNQIFQPEIKFYGIQQYLQDFYFNFGLKLTPQTLFFMGGEDNSNTKILLQNYLSLIYGSPSPNVWANINYTFSTTGMYSQIVDPKTVTGNDVTNLGEANIQFPPSSPTCFVYQITTVGSVSGSLRLGIQNSITKKMVLAQNATLSFNMDSLLDGSSSFRIYQKDIIEIQYDPSKDWFYFLRYSQDYTNLQQLSVMFAGGYTEIQSVVHVKGGAKIQIKFPFQFSPAYKDSNIMIQNTQQITMIYAPDYLPTRIAQIWPSINQNEDIVTLNFKVTQLSGNILIGVCNQEIVNTKGSIFLSNQNLGSGIYMWRTNGWVHNSDSSETNINIGYIKGVIVGVTYIKSNSSILFYKNEVYIYSFPLTVRIKNLNFCVGLQQSGSVINLVY